MRIVKLRHGDHVLQMFTPPTKYDSSDKGGYWRFELTHNGVQWADLGLSDIDGGGRPCEAASLVDALESWLYNNLSSVNVDRSFPTVRKALEALVEEYRS